MAFRNNHAISFGLKGSADISGIIQGGIRLEIECKTGLARQTEDQVRFQQMIEKFGGIYIVARSTEQACDKLQEILGLRGVTIPL